MPLRTLACAAMVVLSAAVGAATPTTEWRVRVYRIGGVSTVLLEGGQATLQRILAGSGMRVVLLDCDRLLACQQPLSSHEFIARLADGYHPAESAVCGAAAPGPQGAKGVLLTVYVGCLRDVRGRLIRSRQVRPIAMRLTEADMAAAVILHEVVHLVLPDEEHGRGLWKGVWTDDDWADLARGRLRLNGDLTRRLTTSDYAAPSWR